MDNTLLPANSDRHVGIIRIKAFFYPHYLSTFLLTKYGRFQTYRQTTGNVQPNLFLDKIRNIKVPIISKIFQEKIEFIVCSALKLKNISNQYYIDAETILLNEFKLDNFTLDNNSINIKNISDSFKITGRLDAEYYQPKYEEYIKVLGKTANLNTICDIHDKNFTPNTNHKYQYIELANIGAYGEIQDINTLIGSDLPNRARRLVHTGQVVISSVEGSLQSCAIITDNLENALCSTGFYVIDSKQINSETLLVLFKSKPMQVMMKQRCSGTILTAISKDEFISMPIPIINDNIQIQIKALINKSFLMRRKAYKSLTIAKQAIETAIEQDEKTALKSLNTNSAS